MRSTIIMSASAVVLFATFAPVHAEVVASRHVAGYCMHNTSYTDDIIMYNCDGSQLQNFAYAGYGQMRVNGQCLDTANGGSNRGTQRGDALKMKPCRAQGNLRSQRWGLDRNTLAFKNEEGWCASVDGQRKDKGTRIIAWDCVGHSSQQWFLGSVKPISQYSGADADALRQWDNRINAAGGNVVATGGGNVVATGGGNVITPSTPNVVATGGGNIVAVGGGNVVATGGGNVVAVGAGN